MRGICPTRGSSICQEMVAGGMEIEQFVGDTAFCPQSRQHNVPSWDPYFRQDVELGPPDWQRNSGFFSFFFFSIANKFTNSFLSLRLQKISSQFVNDCSDGPNVLSILYPSFLPCNLILFYHWDQSVLLYQLTLSSTMWFEAVGS